MTARIEFNLGALRVIFLRVEIFGLNNIYVEVLGVTLYGVFSHKKIGLYFANHPEYTSGSFLFLKTKIKTYTDDQIAKRKGKY